MPTAEARIQLCRHAASINHKILRHPGRALTRPDIQQVEWSDTHGTLDLGWGGCTMHAASEDNLQRVQDLITRNLERFGRREHLKVNWQQPGTPTA